MLGQPIGYRLTLAGIAGFIVAIGITADSFVVYFERLETRYARAVRLRSGAVETAWVRARRTIISADAVSFLAAAVLYCARVGNVRGLRLHPRPVDARSTCSSSSCSPSR